MICFLSRKKPTCIQLCAYFKLKLKFLFSLMRFISIFETSWKASLFLMHTLCYPPIVTLYIPLNTPLLLVCSIFGNLLIMAFFKWKYYFFVINRKIRKSTYFYFYDKLSEISAEIVSFYKWIFLSFLNWIFVSYFQKLLKIKNGKILNN